MEHAKKMVLVPQENVQRMMTPSISMTKSSQILSDLDREMEKILRTPMKTDDEKWTLYKQCLHRFFHFSGVERSPLVFPIASDVEKNTDVGQGENERDIDTENKGVEVEIPLHTEIVSSIPKKLRKKGELLIARLLSSGKVNWSVDGTVTIKGGVIPGSNITDLVGDVMRARKNVNPKGIDSFMALLSEINMPKEFIGNPKRLDLIRRYDSADSVRPKETEISKRFTETTSPNSSRPAKLKIIKRWTPYHFRK